MSEKPEDKKLHVKCAKCGKARGDHKAQGLFCPVGSLLYIGRISFHPTQTFEPRQDSD